MANELALNILLNVRDNGAAGKMSGVMGVLTGLTNPAKAAALGIVAVGAGIVAVAAISTKMAGDYDQAMRRVQSLTGSTNAQMQQYDGTVKALAQDAGVAPTKLAGGLYNVISAGYSGAAAMRVLGLSTKDAVIDMSDSTVTSQALTTVLKGFSVATKNAETVNGEMLRTVTLGKMSFADYASAIAKVTVLHTQFHTSLETTNAALATMTEDGIKNANIAAIDYGQLVSAMDGKTSTVAKRIKKLGLSFDETKFKSLDFNGQLKMLQTTLKGHDDQIQNVLMGSNKAAAAFSVLTAHSKDYASNLAQLSNQQANANATQSAWNITQGGFNQTMNRLHSTLDVILINVGQQLLPMFTKAAQNLLPIIANVGKWITQSGILTGAISLLVGGLNLVFGAISTIVSIGSGFISFLNNGGVAADAVKVVLIALAGAALGFVASGIPALVTGFIAWAVAAGAAAIATLAAAAPFILVGAVIAVVVAGIIIAVKNWGKITEWLSTQWKRFQAFLVNLWTGIQSFLKAALAVVVALILGPFAIIGGLFVWLYNHNTYFKKLVDAIVGHIKPFLEWFKAVWSAGITWLVGKWDGLVGKARDLWNKITGVFKGAWSLLTGALSSLWNNIKSWFDNLATSAITWGANLIGGFIKGITSMLGNVKNAVGGIIHNVANFLGFHSPAKEGPGATADTWAPNLMKMFIGGIQNNIPALVQVVKLASAKIQQNLGAAPARSNVLGFNVSGNGQALASGGGVTRQGAGGNGSGVTVINNYFTITAARASAKDVAKEVIQLASRDLRRGGNFVTSTSGGRAQ